ncbi:MAG: hypothetical protein FJ405_14370 [Verrucomicrobia bacterium]|nr:hypothetical protein [Verrucomicrobiota bacterium]
MINAFLLLLNPGPVWKRLATANRPAWAVFLFTFLPVLLVCATLESWMLHRYGVHNSVVQRLQQVSAEVAMRYGTTQFVMGLIGLLCSAMMIRNITQGIAIRTTFGICFSAMAYSLSAAFLVRLLDAWDFLNTWVVCGFVVISLFSVLYTCIPNFFKPDPAKAFGLYVTAAVISSVCMVASHIFSYMVFQETLFAKGLGLGLLGF